MNEKLTTKQRDWIRMAVGVARGSNTGIAWAEFYTKLNDYTEDEGNYIVWSDGRKTPIEDEELLQYIAENIQQEASDE